MIVQRFEKKDGAVNVAGTLSWVMPNAWTPDEFLNRIFAPKTRETFLYCMRAELREMAVGASIVRLQLHQFESMVTDRCAGARGPWRCRSFFQ